VVLLELLRRGYKVYYYKTKGDKVVNELNLKEVKMTVLCEDSSKILSDGVEVVNVLEWLLS